MRPSALYLIITDTVCLRCATSWRSSYPLMYCANGALGGTPITSEALHLPIKATRYRFATAPACHHCSNLGDKQHDPLQAIA